MPAAAATADGPAALPQEETAFSAPASRGVRKGGTMGGISSDDETDSDEDEMERLRTLSIRTGARLASPNRSGCTEGSGHIPRICL